MKRLAQMALSRWQVLTSPARTPMTTLAEREYERKRRLLSSLLLFSLISALISTVLATVTVGAEQAAPGWAACVMLLVVVWLNRRGYLKGASVTLFVNEAALLFLSAYLASLSHPLTLLWTLSPMALLVALSGLFLPVGMILLFAVAESALLLWYLLIRRYDQLVHLVSSQELSSFVIYLMTIIAVNALIGVFYTTTTSKALIQADRAVELEQAHAALSAAYHELKDAHATIQKQALTDGLTGLPNHRAVVDQLEKELERVRRYGRAFSLLFFDADRFKQVNDRHGHAAGDAVLRQIGERAGGLLRGGDTLGRFGGEEFVLLLPETNADEARAVAERIRAAVAATPMEVAEVAGGIVMTVSLGLATSPTDSDSGQGLLVQADEAMYLAKRLGRNQVRTSEEARQMYADRDLLALVQQAEQRDFIEWEETALAPLRESYTLKMIYSLLVLLERRDPSMSEHAHAVSDLATALAYALNLDPAVVSRIGMAALVHDIGKVALPDLLLQKARPLAANERELLREHAVLGAQILEASPFLYDLMPAVRHHHERWDGRGYPDRLVGEAIPLAARVISVAEAYDALQRERPYQAARTPADARAEMRRWSGAQFDPSVVGALWAVLDAQEVQSPFQMVE
jgi:diguanylate cyclase (GGDEF)-like protein/putative nucleotidyltransferase with HDIG domain